MAYKLQKKHVYGLSLVQNQADLFGYIDEKGNEIIACQYQYASNFYNKVAIVQNKNKKGVINLKGEIIVPLSYENIYFGLYNYIFVEKSNGKVGVFDNGICMIAPEYDEIVEIQKYLVAIQRQSNTIYFPKKENETELRTLKVRDCFEAGNHLIVNSLKAKYGLLDAKGNILTDFIYEYMHFFGDDEKGNSYFFVTEKRKYGLLNQNGELIVPFQYDDLKPSQYGKCFFACIKQNKNDIQKFGAVDFQNNVIIPMDYLEIGDFSGDTFWVKEDIRYNNEFQYEYSIINQKNEKLLSGLESLETITPQLATFKRKKAGLIHTETLEIVLKDQFDNITWADRNDETGLVFLYIEKKNCYGLITVEAEADTYKEVLPCEYLDIMINSDYTYIVKNKKKMCGIVNIENKIVLDFQYKTLEQLYDLADINNLMLFAAQKNELFGVIDINNNEILPFAYDGIINMDLEERTIQVLQKVDIETQYVAPETAEKKEKKNPNKIDNLFSFQDPKTELFGFENDKKEIILPAMYEYTYSNFEDDFCVIGKAKKSNGFYEYGVIDRNGNVIVPCKYEMLEYVGNNLFIFEVKKEKYDILEIQGNIFRQVTIKNYSHFTHYNKTCFASFKKSGVDYLDVIYKNENDKIITKTIEGQIYSKITNDGLVITNKDIYFGFVDLEGNIIIPCIYEQMHEYFSDGLIGVMLGELWGFVDKNNQKQVPFEYTDEVKPFKKGKSSGYKPLKLKF